MIRLEATSTSILATCSACPYVDEFRSLDERALVDLVADHALCDLDPTGIEPARQSTPERPETPVRRTDRWTFLDAVLDVLAAAHARMDARGYSRARPRPLQVSPDRAGEVATRETVR